MVGPQPAALRSVIWLLQKSFSAHALPGGWISAQGHRIVSSPHEHADAPYAVALAARAPQAATQLPGSFRPRLTWRVSPNAAAVVVDISRLRQRQAAGEVEGWTSERPSKGARSSSRGRRRS